MRNSRDKIKKILDYIGNEDLVGDKTSGESSDYFCNTSLETIYRRVAEDTSKRSKEASHKDLVLHGYSVDI